MSQLIDVCGTPIQLEQVKSFRLVKRDYIFYPAYQETQSLASSMFARFGASDKKKFQFVKMMPFGAVLTNKEKPALGGYEIKSFDEAVGAHLLEGVGNAVGNVAGVAMDILRVDTSGNKQLNILTVGRRSLQIRMREIPAKVMFLSGKVSDVYKNDSIYDFLGEPIAPVISAVQALVVNVDKASYVFFGNGIDVEDAEQVYHSLLNAYNEMQARKEELLLATKEKKARMPRIELPKLDFSAIKIQSPFVIKQKALEGAQSPIEEDAKNK